jgi:Leucine-rich repeat (LRR) protein
MFDLVIRNERQTKYIIDTVDELYSSISKIYFKIHVINNVDIQNFPYHLFKNLRIFILDTGNIYTFPSQILQLENLEKLEINNNSFMEFPETITELITLKKLVFFQNLLEVIPPSITKLHNLETLSIIHCNLKEFPTAIVELKKLKELYICGSNRLTIPDNLNELDQLERLGLHTNNIKEFPTCIVKLEKLKYLDMSSNTIKNIPTCIERLKNLEELIMSGNRQMHTCLYLNLKNLKRLIIDRHVNDIILHENVENKIVINNGAFDYNYTEHVRYINEMERIALLRKFKREKMENLSSLVPDKLKCSICYHVFFHPRVNQKGNIYCLECIEHHFRLFSTDPLTNIQCSTSELFPINMIENEVNEFIDNFQMTE